MLPPGIRPPRTQQGVEAVMRKDMLLLSVVTRLLWAMNVITVSGDMLVMGHDRVEEKGRVKNKKSPKEKRSRDTCKEHA